MADASAGLRSTTKSLTTNFDLVTDTQAMKEIRDKEMPMLESLSERLEELHSRQKVSFQQHVAGLIEEYERLSKANLQLSNQIAALRLSRLEDMRRRSKPDTMEAEATDISRPSTGLPACLKVKSSHFDNQAEEDPETLVDVDLACNGVPSELSKLEVSKHSLGLDMNHDMDEDVPTSAAYLHAAMNWESLVGSLLRSSMGDEGHWRRRPPAVLTRRPTSRTAMALAMSNASSPRRLDRGTSSYGGASASGSMIGVRSRSLFDPELWPEWQASIETPFSAPADAFGVYSSQLPGFKSEGMHGTSLPSPRGNSRQPPARPRRCTLLPSSPPRLAWDCMSLLILLFDAIFIPLSAFGLPDYEFIVVMMWVTTIFWTLDMIASLVTGYHYNGMVELRLWKICLNYMRTWFFFDFFIIACDWLVLFSRENSIEIMGMIRIGKSFRMTRVLRAMRLLRLLRILRTAETLWYFATSEIDSMMFGIAKFMVGMLLVNHLVACSWYAVGTVDLGDDTGSWVKTFEEKNGEDATILYRYTSSFHWSITQMTPASMEVNGRNWLERIFTVCVIVMSLILISSIVSSITSAVTQLRKLSFEKSKQQELVRQFIGQKQLSLELGNRIWTFLQKHYTSNVPKRSLHEEDVAFFRLMPDSLRVSLHEEMYLPVLVTCPLLEFIRHMDSYTITRICHVAMNEKSLTSNQELFSYCEHARGMYFLNTGRAGYFKAVSEDNEIVVEPKMHVSAIALWLQWQHHGRLMARGTCEFIMLSSSDFREVISQHSSFHFCKIFAEFYRERVILEVSKHDGGLHDLWYDLQAEHEMLARTHDEWNAVIAATCSDDVGPSRRSSSTSEYSSQTSTKRHLFSSPKAPLTPAGLAGQVASWLRRAGNSLPTSPTGAGGSPGGISRVS